jgi:starvation-inducible DNA-binding protein
MSSRSASTLGKRRGERADAGQAAYHADISIRSHLARTASKALDTPQGGDTMYPTRNDLPEAKRTQLVELCNARLADAIDLQTQTKVAHWNVKGPQFIALHELFDKVVEDVEDYVDLLAERAVQLGGEADGTARSVARRSTLAEYPFKGGGGRKHVDALSAVLASFGKNVREGIDATSRLGDADTNDIFIEISRGVDKWLWMIEAHLVSE